MINKQTLRSYISASVTNNKLAEFVKNNSKILTAIVLSTISGIANGQTKEEILGKELPYQTAERYEWIWKSDKQTLGKIADVKNYQGNSSQNVQIQEYILDNDLYKSKYNAKSDKKQNKKDKKQSKDLNESKANNSETKFSDSKPVIIVVKDYANKFKMALEKDESFKALASSDSLVAKLVKKYKDLNEDQIKSILSGSDFWFENENIEKVFNEKTLEEIKKALVLFEQAKTTGSIKNYNNYSDQSDHRRYVIGVLYEKEVKVYEAEEIKIQKKIEEERLKQEELKQKQRQQEEEKRQKAISDSLNIVKEKLLQEQQQLLDQNKQLQNQSDSLKNKSDSLNKVINVISDSVKTNVDIVNEYPIMHNDADIIVSKSDLVNNINEYNADTMNIIEKPDANDDPWGMTQKKQVNTNITKNENIKSDSNKVVTNKTVNQTGTNEETPKLTQKEIERQAYLLKAKQQQEQLQKIKLQEELEQQLKKDLKTTGFTDGDIESICSSTNKEMVSQLIQDYSNMDQKMIKEILQSNELRFDDDEIQKIFAFQPDTKILKKVIIKFKIDKQDNKIENSADPIFCKGYLYNLLFSELGK